MSGNRPHVYVATANPGSNESAANTETVVLTLAGVSNEFPNQSVALSAFVEFTPGAAATNVTIRVRRGSLTGTLVGAASGQAGMVVPAKLSGFMLNTNDVRAGDFSDSYVVTIQGTGEGGAGTTGQCSLTALVA